MSPSRSSPAVTQAAPASAGALALSAPESQRRRSFASNAVCRRVSRSPPWRVRKILSTRPSPVPSLASTREDRMKGQTHAFLVPPQSRGVLNPQSPCRPTPWAQARARAVAIISPGVTVGLRRNRVIRIAQARSPPSPADANALAACARQAAHTKKVPPFSGVRPELPQHQLPTRLPRANRRYRDSGQTPQRKRQKMGECRSLAGEGKAAVQLTKFPLRPQS